MSRLGEIVAKFRKSSPNIAAAFDEVELRLMALEAKVFPPETPPPPPPNVTSRAQLDAALATGQVDIRCSGVTVTGQLNLHNVSGVIDWGDTRFTGGGARDLNAVWVRTTGLRMSGGLVSNPTGHGILFHESQDVTWHGFKVDGVAGSGVRVFGPGGTVERIDLKGEVTNIGNDLTLDPHAEKGTGLHAAYIGGVGSPVLDSLFDIYAHDCATGSIQVGQSSRCKFWIRAHNLTKVATQQTAGNAFQPFGEVQDCEAWVDGSNVAKVCEPTWLTSGASRIVVHPVVGVVRIPPALVPHPAVTYI